MIGVHFSLAERLLYGLPQAVIAFSIIAALLIANIGGHRLGRLREKDADRSHEGFVISSVIGFLALLTGFTFSLAIVTFNNRAAMVIEEANAVQSTYLAAQGLPEPFRSRISSELHAYVDARIAAATSPNAANAEDWLQRSEQIQERVWTTAEASHRVAPSRKSASVVEKSEHLVDAGQKRVASRLPSIPIAIHVVLLTSLIIAAGVLGFAFTGAARRATGILLLLFTAALVLIVDVEQPTRGFVVESQRPMEKLRAWIIANPPAAIERRIVEEIPSGK